MLAKDLKDFIQRVRPEDRNDQTSREAEFPQHIGVGNPGGHALLHGKFLLQHHPAVNRGGDQIESHLPPPRIRAAGRAEQNGQHAAQDQAPGPARVQHVQVVGLALREYRGGDGIDRRFHRTVGQGENKRAPIQPGVTVGRDCDDGRQHMPAPRKGDHAAITNAVNHQAEKNDRERLGIQSRALD